jgi:hypothetical protein
LAGARIWAAVSTAVWAPASVLVAALKWVADLKRVLVVKLAWVAV